MTFKKKNDIGKSTQSVPHIGGGFYTETLRQEILDCERHASVVKSVALLFFQILYINIFYIYI